MRFVVLLLVACGCMASIEDGAGTEEPAGPLPGSGGTGGADAVEPSGCIAGRRSGPSILRRLTGEEYGNTVRDLLGVTGNPGQGFPIEGKDAQFDFDNAVDGQVASELLAENLIKTAEELSAMVKLDRLTSCLGAVTIDDACAWKFIADFGKRAYRRPLQAWETAQIQALYGKWKATFGDPRQAVRMLVQFFLQSPQFLYRAELVGVGEAKGTAVLLSSHEVASRLSYFLTGSMPDAALFAAADARQLTTPEELATQARRLLGTDRAKAMLIDFHWQWLELEGLNKTQIIAKDTTLYREFNVAVQSAMTTATGMLVQGAFEGNGTLDDLIRGPSAFMNAALASYHGVNPAGPPLSTAFARVSLDPRRTVGVLTDGGWLMKHAGMQETSPIRRGSFIRKRLLCQNLALPTDPAIDTNPRPRRPNTTVRQWLTEAHSAASPACKGCHLMIDPVGLVFERYDAVGRWRDTELLPNDKLEIVPNGKRAPVSDEGDLAAAGDATGVLQGVRELGDRLAGSDGVRECMVRQWFRYAQGRSDRDAEQCHVADLTKEFVRSGGNLRELVVAITRSDAFRYRPAE